MAKSVPRPSRRKARAKTPKKKTVKKKPPAKKPVRKKKAQAKKRFTTPTVHVPAELTGDVARRVWQETEPQLRDRLNLLDIDSRTLILYCQCWQLLHDCQCVLQREGRYITMESGYVSRHPAAVDEKNAIAQIRQLAAELGMTPKSGRRVKVREGSGDALQAFLDGAPE